MEYLISVAIAFGIGWILAFRDTSKRDRILQDKVSKAREEIQKKHAAAKAEIEQQRASINSLKESVQQERAELEKSKTSWKEEYQRLVDDAKQLINKFQTGYIQGRRWLSSAFREYVQTRDMELECDLVLRPRPAWKAAEVVSELRGKRALMAERIKFLEYQLASYEEYFPFLEDYREAILDEAVDLRASAFEFLEEIDPALGRGYLSKQEYNQLSNIEKFQLALDRYWDKGKNQFEIGRLYERYIGYLHERDGWKVEYYGVLKGFEDLGRDLICKKEGRVKIVQCKCWSRSKLIRENHIMQLFGTSVLYGTTEREQDVEPVFVTTTSLSDDAEIVALELGVSVQNEPLQRYPMVKCNVNASNGERIYHLPFDQQYDRVIIGDQPGEFYAESVKEAEDAGFRRAHRWRGDQGEPQR